MKQLYIFLVSVLAVLGLVACTADYDEFGTSHYNVFKNIAFEEQDGDASFSESEHVIKITTVAPAESLETWDSLTIGYISASNLATLHLVDGKFKEFPSDSAGLDSLAQEVSYVKKSLKAGDKIRIPKSQVIYLMVVAENGDPAIWKVEFTIPGVEKEVTSSASEGTSSSEESDVKSSSSVTADQSSSSVEVQKSGDNNFTIKFVDELENKTSNDTIFVTFAQGTDLKTVVLDSTVSFVHRLAKIDVDPKSVKDWSVVQTFKVTAENDSVKTWIVVVDAVKNSATNLTLKFKNQISTSTKNGDAADTISIKLKSDETLETAKIDTCILSSGAKIAPNPSEVESWAESQNFKVTAEDGTERTWVLLLSIAAADYVASSEKELVSISATGEVSAATVNAENKTVVLHMTSKDAMADVAVTIKVSDLASATLASKDLRTPQKLTITAEDGSDVEWTVSADYPKSSAAEIVKFELEGISVTEAPVIDAEKRTIAFKVAYGTNLSEVFFMSELSAEASLTTELPVDLSDGSAVIVVSAEDGSTKEWTIEAAVEEPPESPELRYISIGSQKVVGVIDPSSDSIFFEMDYSKDLKLNSLVVDSLVLSKDAVIDGFKKGGSYDFAKTKTIVVKNSIGETKTYKLKAGYQYPSMNITASVWTADDNKNNYDLKGWDNGNNSFTKQLAVSTESGEVLKMTTTKYMGKIASGNTFTGYFNPKGELATSMLGYKDGNELIDFGRPFYGRPSYVEFDVKYEGKGDSCDLYVVLESRLTKDGIERTANDGKNRYRTSTDVNTMVASAWYRATTVTSTDDPDVVSITDAKRTGFKTIRMKLNYGKALTGSPLYQSSALDASGLKNSKGIDNHLVDTNSPENFPVTHVRIAMAASSAGNFYVGVDGATLYCDAIRFIY
ncbi:MAG: PCMD domain-containing protein [Fibrobacter sp.]|nr:PCMD domain-containing protein [Fibrobacter sp.]